MTPIEKDTIGKALRLWLALREKHGRRMPETPQSFYADFMHSALLERLLEGKEPLDDPPPVSFSYPWYELVEEGHAEAFEVRFCPAEGFEDEGRLLPQAHLLINQCYWPVFEVVNATAGAEEWVVGYYCPRNSSTVHPSRWRVTFLGHDNLLKPRKRWEVRRVSEPDAHEPPEPR